MSIFSHVLHFLFGFQYVLIKLVTRDTKFARARRQPTGVWIAFPWDFREIQIVRLLPDGKVEGCQLAASWYPLTPGIARHFETGPTP